MRASEDHPSVKKNASHLETSVSVSRRGNSHVFSLCLLAPGWLLLSVCGAGTEDSWEQRPGTSPTCLRASGGPEVLSYTAGSLSAPPDPPHSFDKVYHVFSVYKEPWSSMFSRSLSSFTPELQKKGVGLVLAPLIIQQSTVTRCGILKSGWDGFKMDFLACDTSSVLLNKILIRECCGD